MALVFLIGTLAAASEAQVDSWRQPPTVSIPTVTGTPTGPVIIAVEQVNVRSGPGVDYDRVGVLLPNQQVPALGRSPGGDWIQIGYPGVPGNVAWVYAFNVTLVTGPGALTVVEPPPTPTVRATATIDPTLAAQFPNLGQLPPTRLPTYTPAPPVVWPTFAANGDGSSGRGFPPILAMLGLLLLGGFGTLFTFLRSR
jgi:hypothetical protein